MINAISKHVGAITPAQPQERRSLYLQAGQLVAVSEPLVITTILGSCVAITLWDEHLRIGGLNHYMLPFQTSREKSGLRFGNVAWEELLARLIGLGARRDRMVAGIFGGACVMEAFRNGGDHVGARNVELAERLLGIARIHVQSRDTGGRRGRKLTFETDSGRVAVRYL